MNLPLVFTAILSLLENIIIPVIIHVLVFVFELFVCFIIINLPLIFIKELNPGCGYTLLILYVYYGISNPTSGVIMIIVWIIFSSGNFRFFEKDKNDKVSK